MGDHRVALGSVIVSWLATLGAWSLQVEPILQVIATILAIVASVAAYKYYSRPHKSEKA